MYILQVATAMNTNVSEINRVVGWAYEKNEDGETHISHGEKGVKIFCP